MDLADGVAPHPSSKQARFSIGWRLPIGVIAGKATYLDAINGGFWQYEDDSFPKPPPQTVFLRSRQS